MESWSASFILSNTVPAFSIHVLTSVNAYPSTYLLQSVRSSVVSDRFYRSRYSVNAVKMMSWLDRRSRAPTVLSLMNTSGGTFTV